ncbi:MAG: oligosaccharide flippase family protein [Clostridiaceae bacterium]|nr:oligosaccharide flippase family protein [Clostridiaceae bacterium]
MGTDIKKNYFYNMSYNVLVMVTPLITTPYVSRVLGASGIGEYSYSSSIVAYFVLFATLGTESYGRREISYYQNDRKKRSIVFWELRCMVMILNLIVLAVYFVFCMANHVSLVYVVQVFSILSVGVNVIWLLQGIEEFKIVAIRNYVIRLSEVAFIFLFVRDADDTAVYAFGCTFLVFVGNLLLWPVIGQYVDRPKLSELHIWRHLKPSFRLFIPAVAISIYGVMDKTMIGLITGSSEENGYYEQAMKIPKLAVTLLTSLGTVMLPRIGHCYINGDLAKIRGYMYRSCNFVWFLGVPMCLGLMGIARNIVPWFFGSGYDGAVAVLQVGSFLMLAVGMNNIFGNQLLIPTKREKLYTISVITGAAVNVILNSFLINLYAAKGAAIASVAAEASIAICQLIMVRKELSPMRILALSKNYVIAGVVMLAVLLYEDRCLNASVLSTCFMMLSGAAVYVAILLIMRDDFLLTNLRSFTKKGKGGNI